ncbi:MAG: hypothetical protein VX499_04565 [Bacteroidota bacterium]|nr:hypothetical protein [Bacteroidota bacterium]
MNRLVYILILLIVDFTLLAQPGWNWPENKAEAEEKNVLYTDYLKQGDCEASREPNNWLLSNVPNLHVSIYQNGIKIYRCLIDKETDLEKKKLLIQKSLEIFDNRIENFGREAYVKNRKVSFAYSFYRSDKAEYENLYNMFKDAYQLNGNKIGNSNLVAFMDIVRKHKLTSNNISDDEVLEIYDMISNTISYKITNEPKNETRLRKYQDNVDKLLTATITVDCDFVENTLGPKLVELSSMPSDEIVETDYESLTPVETQYTEEVVNLAKKIFQLSITGKCTSSDIALQAAKIMFSTEKDFAIAKFIAGREQANNNYDTALEYYDGAIESTDDNLQKAEVYLNKAQLYALVGNKIKSRNNARKSISMDSQNTDAYKLIGNLYMSSYDDCREGKSRVKDRLVFIAAYNMYKRGGLTGKANQAREQFPSMEEIFNENLEVGESMNTGCWINESVTLNKR